MMTLQYPKKSEHLENETLFFSSNKKSIHYILRLIHGWKPPLYREGGREFEFSKFLQKKRGAVQIFPIKRERLVK